MPSIHFSHLIHLTHKPSSHTNNQLFLTHMQRKAVLDGWYCGNFIYSTAHLAES